MTDEVSFTVTVNKNIPPPRPDDSKDKVPVMAIIGASVGVIIAIIAIILIFFTRKKQLKKTINGPKDGSEDHPEE